MRTSGCALYATDRARTTRAGLPRAWGTTLERNFRKNRNFKIFENFHDFAIFAKFQHFSHFSSASAKPRRSRRDLSSRAVCYPGGSSVRAGVQNRRDLERRKIGTFPAKNRNFEVRKSLIFALFFRVCETTQAPPGSFFTGC